MPQTNKIEIEIVSEDAFDFNIKKEALINIAKLDSDTLSKLSELSRNENAIKKLKSNWFLLKNFVG